MPALDYSELCTDKVLSKGRILQELTKAVKLVYIQSLHGNVVLDRDSWLVYWLDRALRHGLRVERHGYWGTVRDLSHQDTVVVIHALQNVLTSIGKGKAWLYHTLSEGSFESYLACFLRDTKTLKKQYFTHALLRDTDKTSQLIDLLVGLENVSFTLELDVSHLDIVNYTPRRPMNSSPPPLALQFIPLSFSSSLGSPGDSGLPILDSDMDASNEIDGSSYKEEEWSSDSVARYCNKYGNGYCNINRNFEKPFSYSELKDNKTAKKSILTCNKLTNTIVTESDIVNQNYNAKIEDDFNAENVDEIKDFNKLDEIMEYKSSDKLKPGNDIENNGFEDYATISFESSNKFLKSNHNSYVINNETNLMELSMTISDCDDTMEIPPYSILNTTLLPDTSILSSSYSIDPYVVQRRQRKKKRSDTKKRVSFHEDIFKMMKLEDDETYSDFCMSFQPGSVPNSVQNRKNDERIDRHSWCVNNNNSEKQCSISKNNRYSDCYSSTSTLSLFDSDMEQKKIFKYPSCLSMSERGVPEGQEDPLKSIRPTIEIELDDNEAKEAYDVIEEICGDISEDASFVKLEMPNNMPNKYAGSTCDFSDIDSILTVSDFIEDKNKTTKHLNSPLKKSNTTSILTSGIENISRNALNIPTVIKQGQTSKSSLLSRFLKSLTERKLEIKRDKKSLHKKPSNLFIKGVKVNKNIIKEFDEELQREIEENQKKKELTGEKISPKLKETFRKNIFRDKTEQLYKVFKVRCSYMTNGESKPMLAILTDKTLYLTAAKADHSYSNQFVIPYNELDVIMIGPNAQTILISNADNEMQYLFSTGSSQHTSEILAHLEIAMRRCPSKPRLPAVKELSYSDMHTLKHCIVSETAVQPEEKIEYYSLIFMEDDHLSPPSTPCGPVKEGDLMFRSHTYYNSSINAPTSPWEAGYFVLKGGVVYIFTDSNQRLPKRAIPLKGGLCLGCRRIPNSQRPHTFEILLQSNKAIQFAAPDEYVASDWLQSFIQSASGSFDHMDKRQPLPCSVIVTSRHLVAVKEIFPAMQRGQILSCASIADLSAFRVTSEQKAWCILEFDCREVHESSGDWVVYFANYKELCIFQGILERMWELSNKTGEFPISTILPEDNLVRRCCKSSKTLDDAWQYLLPPIETD